MKLRKRVVDVAPAANGVAFASHEEDEELDDSEAAPRGSDRGWLRESSLDEVAEVVGVSRERVRQIEEVALEKVRLGLAIEEQLGVVRAAPILAQLRGADLRCFRSALRALSG